MKSVWRCLWLICCVVASLSGMTLFAADVILEKVVSHEDAKFEVARSRMTMGRDGRLYFASGEYLLRMDRDGSNRAGSRLTYAMSRGTANADGVIGTGHGHFAHSLKTWRADFSEIGVVADFLNSDQVQYWAPCDVQAGSSGDFFGYDSNRNRITRVSAAAKLLTTYSLDGAGLNTVGKLAQFRVWEPGQRFYIRFENALTCVGFDGRILWKLDLGATGDPWGGWRDVFDVDAEGRLLVLARDGDIVKVFDKEGQPEREIKLEIGQRRGRYEDLAVWQKELFVKRDDPMELCAAYDLATGAFKRSITANAEILRATIPSVVWTAAEAVPVTMAKESRVWLRPFNTPDFVELPLLEQTPTGLVPVARGILHNSDTGGSKNETKEEEVEVVVPKPRTSSASPVGEFQVRVPENISGLFHLRITSDVRGAGGDYQLDTIVEIRVPNAKGSVSIFTPLNRLYFGNGETIPVSVVTRTPFPDELPRQWRVRLMSDDRRMGTLARPNEAEDKSGKSAQPPVFEHFILTTADRPQNFNIPSHITQRFLPGRYVLTTDTPGFTVAPQYLVIGAGIETPPKFSLVQHGDYTASFPLGPNGKPSPFETPDLVADHLRATRQLHLNLFADRIGLGGAGVKQHVMEKMPTDELVARLTSDPLAVSPEKAKIENTLRQTVAARGAFGQEQRGIFLMMDAGLPLGTGFDGRTAEQREADLRDVNDALKSYPAFRGWNWAANWWLGKTGTSAAKGDANETAYQAALKKVKDTGEWSPVLDEVSNSLFAHAVNAERDLNVLQFKHSPGRLMLSTMTGPYRAVYTHPPIIFQNADEVDLHYQMEQIQPPSWTAHATDFLKRPNKRAWGHPEIWNDDGTGGMLLPTLLPMALRGADGIGWSGRPHDWTPQENDSRAGGPGLLSMLRSLNELLTIYGPWHTTLENRDRIAIVVSTRMQRIEGWHGHLGSKYHEQLFEAYNACLYSHRPAKFVFVEDLKPDSFQHAQAVLIVGQRVELDPTLKSALTELKKTSPDIRIFFDGTCREELVKSVLPTAESLGVTFDKLNTHGEELAQDDSLYARMPRWFFAHALELKKILADVTPVAQCNQPEVLLFERFSGDARFVWVLNNTRMLEDNPGLAWRTSLIMSQRAPVVALLDFKSGPDFVYDMLGHQRRKSKDDPRAPAADVRSGAFAEPLDTSKPILADLRSSPVRLYAILPSKPDRMKLEIPNPNVAIGGSIDWKVLALDADAKPINANLPIRIVANDQNKTVLQELFTTTQSRDGASGSLPVPTRGVSAQVSVGVTELLTAAEKADTQRVQIAMNRVGATAPEHRFGSHFKDIAISADGKMGLVSAFNWHENVWAFDVETGMPRWRQRIGDHFTYSPQAAGDGFAIQGFDKHTAEGYHLFLLDPKGEAIRRFALFGLPKRATSWSNGSHILDRGINNFAASPDGAWVAAAGDLGLAVWSRDGEVRWSVLNSDLKSEIATLKSHISSGRLRRWLFVPDTNTLIAATGRGVTAHSAVDGQVLWTLSVAPTGSVTGGQLSGDGKTLALRTDTDGGRVLIIRDRKIVGTIFGPADVALPTPDGQFVAVTYERQLKWYSADGQFAWQFTGDEYLRNPAISHDGQRAAVCSELGTLTTLSSSGEVLGENDVRALATLKFLKEGDLLAATWTGNLMRFQGGLNAQWLQHFVPFPVRIRSGNEPRMPGERDIKFQFGPLPDNRIWMGWPLTKVVPTTRMTGWGNSAPEAAPLTPNLLADTPTLIQAWCDPPTHGDPRDWKQPIEMLTDGKPDAPPRPWLDWSDINYIDSGWRQKLTLGVDTFREQLRVNGVTLAEDAAHPESWFRDVRLQWWDATEETWRDGPYLTWDAAAKSNTLDVVTNAEFTPNPNVDPADDSPRVIIETCIPPADGEANKPKKPKDGADATPNSDSPNNARKPIVHTHWFAQPIEAAKFRFVTTGGGAWPSGNLRLGELVFHGEQLGCSHPDAIAKKPRAILFDENETDLRSSLKHGHNPHFDFLYDGSFSGGKCLSLKQAGQAGALFRSPFGHAIPNWNFEIAEKPQPGQYRWLQFAWKATSPKTTGIGLLIGRSFPGGGYAITCGEASFREGAVATKTITGTVPTDWRTVQIDLWELFHKKPTRIQSLNLLSTGDGAAFDQIVLGRDVSDLSAPKKSEQGN